MSEKSVDRSQNVAYPDDLREREDKLLRKRRAQAGLLGGEPRVGFALSGGGIRSATFSLGVFQALARLGLIGRIDYISTVSGGGYFGAFLGRLFARKRIRSPGNVEDLLNPDKIEPGQPGPVRWLRLSSRFLTPSGNGDMLTAFAMVARNWTALQIVTVSFMLMGFVAMQILRGELEILPLYAQLHPLSSWLDQHAPLLWWSPWLNLLAPIVVLGVFPAGWAFWIADRFWRRGQVHPLWGLTATVLLGVGGVAFSAPAAVLPLCRAMSIVGMLTFMIYVVIGVLLPRLLEQIRARFEAPEQVDLDATLYNTKADVTGTDQEDDLNRHAQQLLTRTLSLATGLGLGVLLLGVLDTLGQSFYVLWFQGYGAYIASIGSSAALLIPVLVRVGKLPSLLGSQKDGAKFKVPVGLIAWPIASVLALGVASGVNALSHAAAWSFERPPGVELVISAPSAVKSEAASASSDATDNSIAAERDKALHAGLADMFCLTMVFAVLFLFSWLFGRTWPFVNRSSLHAFYSMRLTRAYLGASNKRRLARVGKNVSVIDPIPGDDLSYGKYAALAGMSGGPLHLINVTLNETASEGGKTVLRDRKGVSMAVGPCGFSVGVQHHALIEPGTQEPVFKKMVDVIPVRIATALKPLGKKIPLAARQLFWNARYRPVIRPLFAKDQESTAFGHRRSSRILKPELLSIGHWTAISGAAVSTGLGSMSSIPLSFLLGFSNIRLGYWWDSRVDTSARKDITPTLGRRMGRLLRLVFPVQKYLLDEFTATFHGTEEPRWYLTDGGHFENMGAYELIRRRLPLMVIVDGEADADYACGGLANLVRKARMDFGAEIEFLDTDGIKSNVHKQLGDVLGPLVSLCPNEKGISTSRAALARVKYADKANPDSWLLYIKATLTGKEPADLREYRISNPGFPQQSTADQFFDETQWECYRRLGEQIGDEIFKFKPLEAGPCDGFVPGLLNLPPVPDA